MARGYARLGVRRIVALRGDPPKGETRFVPHPDGFASAAELVAGLREVGDFEIAVGRLSGGASRGGERRRRTSTTSSASSTPGASMALTQFFFDNEDFLRFRDACAGRGSRRRSIRASCRWRISPRW